MIETFEHHPFIFAPVFLAMELGSGLAFIIYLQRFKAKGLPPPPGGPNPIRRPIALASIALIVLAITGLGLTVGRGWCLFLQSPIFLFRFLIRKDAPKRAGQAGTAAISNVVLTKSNRTLKLYIVFLAIISTALLFLLIDGLGSSIVGTSGSVVYAHEYYSRKRDRIECQYSISVSEGSARGTFGEACKYKLGERVDLDVRIARITGLVTIVGGSLRKAAVAM